VALLALVLACGSCERREVREPERFAVGENEAWLLEGTPEDRFARAARHLRGLDVAMLEIGLRYEELYWAGADRNWPYARYQVGKIRTALALAVERRPKRAASATMLEASLQALDEAIAAEDEGRFGAAFPALTQLCNACHAAEQVPSFHVRPPELRRGAIGAAPR
jgi:hypothetical protein